MISGAELSFTITARDIKYAVKSQTYSKTYVKTLLKASMINIIYHRFEIDEKHFAKKSFKDIPYVTFKPRATNPLIRKFHSWVHGIDDALTKGYIRQIFLFMRDSDTEEVLENYKFSLQYHDDMQRTPVAAEDLTQTSSDFLRTLRLLADHPKLSLNTDLHIEFAYYDHTPEDYEPPGFEASKECLALNVIREDLGASLILGKIATGYHTITCSARGKVFRVSRAATPALTAVEEQEGECTEEQMNTCLDSEVFPITEDYTNKAVVNGDMERDATFTEKTDNEDLTRKAKKIKSITSIANITLDSDDDSVTESPNYKCLCELHLNDVGIDFVKCGKCNRKFHAPCVGFHDKKYAPSIFFCIYCDKTENPNDMLTSMPPTEYKSYCSVRLFISLISKYQEIPHHVVKQLPQDVSKGILAKLRKLAILKKSDSGGVYIDFEKLKHMLISFFITTNNSQMLTETQDITVNKKKQKII